MHHGETIIAHSPTLLDDLKNKYPFFYAQTKDIKLGDLPKLLEQYKDLALS